ncbi:MAG TPA: DUF3857 domain-containing protein [Spirochaetia bacterium]
MRRFVRGILPVWIFLFLGAVTFAADRQYGIAPAPSWVARAAAPASSDGSASSEEALAYLLVDYQANVGSRQRYTHIVMEVRTAEGVQDGSTITIDFDPSYEQLTINTLDVKRGGMTKSRLGKDEIQILHREPDLESFILDGSLTASIVLKDVRIGDIIDYSYTVKGSNPAFGGRWVGEYSCGWHVAVAQEQVRVLVPSGRTVRWRMHGTTVEPTSTAANGLTTLQWSFTNLKPVVSEDLTPSWYVDAPWIELSEFESWEAVRAWAVALYPSAKLPADLTALTKTWMKDSTDPERRARAALDYVQQNIRYLGIELGAGSYKPRSPEKVHSRRFGDCKDQVYLLMTLLRAMGIDSAPMLVSTGDKDLVADLLPSPIIFDHVILSADIGGRTAYLDPTRSYQRGNVLERYAPDYGWGLLVGGLSKGLTRFGAALGTVSEAEVEERFVLGGKEEPARLDVTTTARGDSADFLRGSFASRRRDEIAKNYLNFYAERYPSIQTAERLTVTDDAENDVFTTVEHYTIGGIWTPGSEKDTSVAGFYPDIVRSEIPVPRTKVRSTPMFVTFPRHVVQRITVELPEKWNVKPEDTTQATDAFTLRTRVSSKENTITLVYEYTSKAEQVTAARMATYNRDVMRIEDSLGYELTWGRSETVSAAPRQETTIPAAPVILLVITAVLIGCCILVYWSATHDRSGALLSAAPGVIGAPGLADPAGLGGSAVSGLGSPAVSGLGGWLILVAVTLFAQPIASAATLGRIVPLLKPETWKSLTDPAGARYHALWGPTLFLEAVTAVALGLACVLLIVLFFQKRRLFPRLYVGVRIAAAVLVAADLVLVTLLPPAKDVVSTAAGQLAAALIACALWVPYMLKSRRVRATFTA